MLNVNVKLPFKAVKPYFKEFILTCARAGTFVEIFKNILLHEKYDSFHYYQRNIVNKIGLIKWRRGRELF